MRAVTFYAKKDRIPTSRITSGQLCLFMFLYNFGFLTSRIQQEPGQGWQAGERTWNSLVVFHSSPELLWGRPIFYLIKFKTKQNKMGARSKCVLFLLPFIPASIPINAHPPTVPSEDHNTRPCCLRPHPFASPLSEEEQMERCVSCCGSQNPPPFRALEIPGNLGGDANSQAYSTC